MSLVSADLDLVKRAVVFTHTVVLAADNVTADGLVCIFGVASAAAGICHLVHL